MRFSVMFASWSAATKDKSTIGNSGMKKIGSIGSRTSRGKRKAKWYGRVFCRFADTVHTTNPDAKVMFGGVAGLTVRPASTVVEFAEDALAGCPGKIDIMAYHSYAADPSGTVRPPEEIDTAGGAADFRKGVLSISGVRPDLEFWLNEWNANPEMKGSNSIRAGSLSSALLP